MTECKDLQALGKITSEVDESHVKIILSSQCIKAQKFLVERLKKETERQKEVCRFISSGNIKLEAEIKHAEKELRSMMSAYDTIKSANVEVKKEVLLAQEKKIETNNRVVNGIKKYEDLWLQCKKRYESIPFVQKWFELTNKTQASKDRIQFLNQEIENLQQEINTKKDMMQDLDKQRVLEIAKFLIHEKPLMIEQINNKIVILDKLNNEIAEYVKEELSRKNKIISKQVTIETKNMMLLDGDWPSLCKNIEPDIDSLGMPKLHLAIDDLNIRTVNLGQIKKLASTTPTKTTEYGIKQQKTAIDEQKYNHTNYFSTYFDQSYLNNNEVEKISTEKPETINLAKKKLINILEDISIDDTNARNIVSGINPNTMQMVNIIGGSAPNDEPPEQSKNIKVAEKMECEQIEEIDMSAHASNSIIIPPVQFLDLTQNSFKHCVVEDFDIKDDLNAKTKVSQDNSQKKKVSFELPVIQEVLEESTAEVDKIDKEENVTDISQLDVSGTNDESFNRIEEMILRKHSLDLSPDFIYAKNNTKNGDNIVISKFFNNNRELTNKAKNEIMDSQSDATVKMTSENNFQPEQINTDKKNIEISQPMMSDDKISEAYAKNEEKHRSEKPVSGLLFTHGPHGIPDSLDVSISTTAYEEGDADFPHCMDASLLLSPKADIPMPVSGGSTEVFSQEVPNFLSGLRKTGLSFFGNLSTATSNQDSNATNSGNNFNFNFGGDDKKSRGGLFSMFQ